MKLGKKFILAASISMALSGLFMPIIAQADDEEAGFVCATQIIYEDSYVVLSGTVCNDGQTSVNVFRKSAVDNYSN